MYFCYGKMTPAFEPSILELYTVKLGFYSDTIAICIYWLKD